MGKNIEKKILQTELYWKTKKNLGDHRKHPTKKAEHGPAKECSSDWDLQSKSKCFPALHYSENSLSDIIMFMQAASTLLLWFRAAIYLWNKLFNFTLLDIVLICCFGFFAFFFFFFDTSKSSSFWGKLNWKHCSRWALNVLLSLNMS